MDPKRYAYYARCIAIDQTAQYQRDLETIKALGFEPLELSPQEKQEGYKKEGMEFFLRLIRERADVLFFRSMPSLRIGAGVFKEIAVAKTKGIPVLELPSSILSREMTVEQTREYLHEVGQR